MAAQPLIAPMAPDIDLDTGCTVVFEAINPTTGAAVTGVTISNALLRVDYAGGGDGSSGPGPFLLIPGPSA